jgi:hypothetical protein
MYTASDWLARFEMQGNVMIRAFFAVSSAENNFFSLNTPISSFFGHRQFDMKFSSATGKFEFFIGLQAI